MKQYKIVFKEVQKAVNEHDPVGLIEGGAPEDEYYAEIEKLVSLLRTETKGQPLADKIEKIFIESFGSDINADKNFYLLISQSLLELKERLGWR